MDEAGEKDPRFNPADLPAFPPTDETGDVDLSLIDYNLSLTIPERIQQHNDALQLVRALEKVRRLWYRTGGQL
jgi:hypothetical protein